MPRSSQNNKIILFGAGEEGKKALRFYGAETEVYIQAAGGKKIFIGICRLSFLMFFYRHW
jgi:hypothetical protein